MCKHNGYLAANVNPTAMVKALGCICSFEWSR